MAALSNDQMAELRRAFVDEGLATPDYTKAQINAMLQAIEDWYEGERAVVSGLINTATAPKVFTNAEKLRAAKFFLKQKFGRGG